MQDRFTTGEFLLGHLPSFTNLGFACRKRDWAPLDLQCHGQRWLVTGASTGIGREIARRAALAGAHVIGVARNAAALDALKADVAGSAGRIDPVPVDLSLLTGVEPLIEAVSRGGPMDVLVNNVGVLLDEALQTAEGRDMAFATNLLVPFDLTKQLHNRGLLARNATIITMSSGGMYNERLEIDKLERSWPYDGVLAYARHKRAQVTLNGYWRQHAANGHQYYVMHPGWVDTPGVARSLPKFRMLMRPWLRDVAAGADTALWLAQTRPRQSTSEGIWFDRALRPAHALPRTRSSDSAQVLVDFLEAARANATETTRGMIR